MSKITNDRLSWSGIGCFIIAVPIWQLWASKGKKIQEARLSLLARIADRTSSQQNLVIAIVAKWHLQLFLVILGPKHIGVT